MEDVVSRLKAFMENEARSCSMDFGGVTPEYVYRMWGGKVAMEEIKAAMAVLRSEGRTRIARITRMVMSQEEKWMAKY